MSLLSDMPIDFKKAARVLIVSPYYKRKAVVHRTIESILSQTYQDFAAIVWDDFSQDGTAEELKRVAAEFSDPRLYVYAYEYNIGLTKGLNEAIKAYDCEYVAIVGSGDECHPDRIMRQVESLDANPDAVLCATASICVDEITGQRFSDEYFDEEIVCQKDIEQVVPFTHGSVMYRRSELIHVGLYEETFKWCADWDMFFRLLNGRSATYLPVEYYTRYATVDGVSFNPKKSVEQLKYKYLAKSLQSLNLHERANALAEARENLELYTARFNSSIGLDLFKRQVKLYLMGRSEHALELGLHLREYIRVPLKYKLVLLIARLFGRTGISTDALVRSFRRIAFLLGR